MNDLLLPALTALNAAEWEKARALFEVALNADDSAEAHDGLGLALWWLNEIPLAHQHRTTAYNHYKARGDNGKAAIIACWLGREQLFLNANNHAMRGWFARAERLLQQQHLPLEQAWFVILHASVNFDVYALEQTARETVMKARQLKHSNLEAFALAFHGQALVTLGLMSEGMAALDEAMTMATGGEVGDLNIISEIFCVMLSTCETAADLVRSAHWCEVAAEFAERHHSPFLSAYCRTSYGALMTALGRWREAETALMASIAAFEQGHRGLRVHAVIRLADLRLSQGMISEAEILLAGLEDQSAAVVPLARMYFAKGDKKQARAILEQALPVPSAYTLHHIPVLFALVNLLLSEDANAAAQQVENLRRIVGNAQSELFAAQIALLQGRICLQMGDLSAARTHFDHALASLRFYEQSLLAGQVRLQMAHALRESDPLGAAAWAKGALATFERIGALPDRAEAAGLLRQLGVRIVVASERNEALTEREIEIARLIADGLGNRDIAARLVISSKTVEHHVSHILDKLQLRSRAQIAAFVASGKLPK